MSRKTGFSLVEMMILMIFISFTIIATIPLMTLKKRTSGVNSDTKNCIVFEQAASFNFNSGSISGTPSVYCNAAINNCVSESGTDCQDAITYAGSGTAAEKLAAEKVLRAACDLGGDSACNYFINKCEVNNQCDVGGATEAKNLDLDYYLKLLYMDSNTGRSLIQTDATVKYNAGAANIVTEVNTVCPSSHANQTTACGVRG